MKREPLFQTFTTAICYIYILDLNINAKRVFFSSPVRGIFFFFFFLFTSEDENRFCLLICSSHRREQWKNKYTQWLWRWVSFNFEWNYFFFSLLWFYSDDDSTKRRLKSTRSNKAHHGKITRASILFCFILFYLLFSFFLFAWNTRTENKKI